ncbi:MAG TPA: hypothetical protein VFC78_07925 [Tepidisphaeraceae bacterium]|nr:hypothetical protein [Tepidisphaeraceae bacterium]
MALEQEQQTYAQELPHLIESAGKFVLIHGNLIAGTYDTYQDALKVGYDRFGLTSFMVKQIAAVERVSRFTRDISVCRT